MGRGDRGSGASIDALERIYRAEYRRFLRVALTILGSREAAADAVQEGFARAIRDRSGFRGEGSLEAWVWRTVVNAALTQSRRLGDRRWPADPPDVAFEGDGGVAWVELRARIARLPERQRVVLFLRHYADLTYEQIAAVLEVERGTVAATLHSAHATLREAITEVTR